MMLTEVKEHVLEQGRETLHISTDMYGDMGVNISPNGSVQHLIMEIFDVDKNRNDEGVCL
jgi:hypothetical protein